MMREELTQVSGVMTSLFPESWLTAMARKTGAVKRLRKVSPSALFWTLVLGFGIGKKRTLASLRRQYELATSQALEESSFYQRFNKGLVKFLRRALGRALEELETGSKSAGRIASGFRELLLVDATVLRLHDLMFRAYPGTRVNQSRAAAKLHMVYNVGKAAPSQVRLTKERTSDTTPWKRIGSWVRGSLLVFDRGYFSYPLLSRIHDKGGYFLIRLKKTANPMITANNLPCRGRSVPLIGRKLHDVLPKLRREALDVQVELEVRHKDGKARERREARLVGLLDKESREYFLYLTNVAPEVLDPDELQSTYAQRWQVEVLFKEMKSHYRLGELPSRNRHVVDSLIWTAVLSLLIGRGLLLKVREKILQWDEDDITPLKWARALETLAPALLLDIASRLTTAPTVQDLWTWLRSMTVDPKLTRPSDFTLFRRTVLPGV